MIFAPYVSSPSLVFCFCFVFFGWFGLIWAFSPKCYLGLKTSYRLLATNLRRMSHPHLVVSFFPFPRRSSLCHSQNQVYITLINQCHLSFGIVLLLKMKSKVIQNCVKTWIQYCIIFVRKQLGKPLRQEFNYCFSPVPTITTSHNYNGILTGILNDGTEMDQNITIYWKEKLVKDKINQYRNTDLYRL